MIKPENLVLQESTPEEIIIYQYLRSFASRQSPEDAIAEFKLLLIEGKGERDNPVSIAWSAIILSQQQQAKFNYILNRCFFILINCWLTREELQEYIPILVDSVNIVSRNSRVFDRTKRSLFKLIDKFKQTEQYLNLKRLTTILSLPQQSEQARPILIKDLLNRYPWLYQAYLKIIDPFSDIQESLQKLQQHEQNKYEIKLAQYLIYRARLVQVARARLLVRGAGKLLKKADNPTLLDELTLKIALKKLLGQVDGQYTCWEIAQRFLAEHRLPTTYEMFKHNLVDYLIASFKQEQQKELDEIIGSKILKIMPVSNSQQFNQLLLRRTCNQVLNILLVEEKRGANASLFTELVNYLGVVSATVLLIKIIILCPDIKPNLNKKFALLYTSYESLPYSEIPWLVQSLEILQIGLSLYLGKIDKSIARII